MNKRLNLLLYLFATLIAIFSVFPILSFSSNWEIRNPLFSTFFSISISLLILLFFLAITVKAFIAKKKRWMKYILSIPYTLIIALSVYNYIVNSGRLVAVYTIIFSVVVLFVLFVVNKQIVNKVIFIIHSILSVVLSSIFFYYSISHVKRDIVEEDSYLLYKKTNGNIKVVKQGNNDYIILFDLGFIRKIRGFNGDLPDGNWNVYGENGSVIAQVTVERGKVVKRQDVAGGNTILVKSVYDIITNLKKKNITFLLDGNYTLKSPIRITNCSNISFKSFPGKGRTNIISNNNSCFLIESSSNIRFSNINFSSFFSDNIIKINRSKNIEITNCNFNCNKLTKVGIDVDEKSLDVSISENKFYDPLLYSVRCFSGSVEITGNQFLNNIASSRFNSVLLRDKRFNENTFISLIEMALKRKYGNLFNTFKDDEHFEAYDIYHIYDASDLLYYFNYDEVIDEFISSNYCSDCKCNYNFCSNLIELITGQGIVVDQPYSGDKWCFRNDNIPKFSFVNPEFFYWLKNKVDLKPDFLIDGVSCRLLYNYLFKNLARKYYVVYMQLKKSGKKNQLVKRYKYFCDSPGLSKDIFLFLYHEYKNTYSPIVDEMYIDSDIQSESNLDLGKFYERSKVDLYNTKIYIDEDSEISARALTKILSFWLRREIDGSSNAIFETLDYYLESFDNEWLNSKKI
ncbi:MAG: ribulose-phosphate 3-epimerase [Tenuifilum sp.]|jgi:hypothetical protein|uniref:right-handed parallel beta-helix repeat-containing protein n=1 Tax=Tenuifilum sp. TaxID=2760880 RepID=UPI0024AA64F8|nr:hypothetical protein [Tenuifilum sp.]MDI3526510.1 ribulose-phosphate 3-epimerase [Tenuifilum sp.]